MVGFPPDWQELSCRRRFDATKISGFALGELTQFPRGIPSDFATVSTGEISLLRCARATSWWSAGARFGIQSG